MYIRALGPTIWMPWPTNTWYMKSSLAWSSQHSRAFAAGGGSAPPSFVVSPPPSSRGPEG
eukprot:5881520-Pyramimonas_sp.AAC.1